MSSFVPGEIDWTDRKDVVRVKDWLLEQRELKRPLEVQTATNCAFYDGKQFLEWSETERKLIVPDHLRDAQRTLVYNWIRPLVQQRLAILNLVDTVWKAPAHSSHAFDLMVQRFANELLSYYWKHGLRMPMQVERLIRMVSCAPVTWSEPFWDPTLGPEVTVGLDTITRDIPQDLVEDSARDMRGEDEELFRGFMGFDPNSPEGMDQKIPQRTGDLAYSMRTVFNTTWYPFRNMDTFDDTLIYLVSEPQAPELVAHRYRMPLKEVMRHRDGLDAQRIRGSIARAWAHPWIEEPGAGLQQDNSVTVHRLIASKIMAPPNGAVAVIIGNSSEAIRLTELPNRSKRMPLFHIIEFPSSMTPWGGCSIDDVLSAQLEINSAENDAADWRAAKLDPIFVRSTTDGNLDQEALEKKRGVYDVTRMTEKPTILQLPGQGVENEQARQYNLQYMQRAMAIPDVLMGDDKQSGQSSGKRVIALQKEAKQRFRNLGLHLDDHFSQIGTYMQADLQDNALDERVTPLTGADGSREYRTWSAKDLQPQGYAENPELFSIVTVEAFKNIPDSPEEVRELVFAMIEAKVLIPGEHDQIIADAIGRDEFKGIVDQGRSARTVAVGNTQKWRRGQPADAPIEVSSHKQYIKVYLEFIDSDDFRLLLEQTPPLAGQVLEHLRFHEQAQYDRLAEDQLRQSLALSRATLTLSPEMMAINREARKLSGEAAAAGDMGMAKQLFALSLGGAAGSAEDQDEKKASAEQAA